MLADKSLKQTTGAAAKARRTAASALSCAIAGLTLTMVGCASSGAPSGERAAPVAQQAGPERQQGGLVLSYTLREGEFITSIENRKPPDPWFGADAIAALMSIKNLPSPQ